MKAFYHKKSLGQNFLRDRSIINRLCNIILGLHPERVFEIGPGSGAIAQKLEKHVPLVLIEKDKRLIPCLKANFPNAVIINKDIRDMRLHSYNIKKRDLLFSNLPYSSSTAILQDLLLRQPSFENYVLMFQKEMADRLKAVRNSREYGYISVLAQVFCDIDKLMLIPPDAFYPVPKVDSVLLQMVRHNKHCISEDRLESFVCFLKTAFSQRRKKLRAVMPDIKKVADNRPQELSPEEFVSIFHLMQDQ